MVHSAEKERLSYLYKEADAMRVLRRRRIDTLREEEIAHSPKFLDKGGKGISRRQIANN